MNKKQAAKMYWFKYTAERVQSEFLSRWGR